MGVVNDHISPEPGITEIRVHGVGGATPEALLEQTGVIQATGDERAGFFRGVAKRQAHTVEAYSWGGLTSRSRSRAFWVLLLPFSFINLAGWMVEPPKDASVSPPKVETWNRTFGTRWHEAVVQSIGIATTAMYVMWAALISMSTLAFQCAGIPNCRSGRWYLQFLGGGFYDGHPGRRVVTALLVPIGLLVLFSVLGRLSRDRYDQYGVAGHAVDRGIATKSVLGLPGFWYTASWQKQTARFHIAYVLLILGGLLARASARFEAHFEVDVVPNVGDLVFGVSVVAWLAVSVVLFVGSFRKTPLLEGDPLLERFSRIGLWLSVGIMAVAAWLTWRLDVPDDQLAASVPGEGGAVVLEPVTDLWGFGWTPILLLVIAVGLVGLFSGIQLWRWMIWRQVNLDQMVVPVMLAYVVLWDVAWAVFVVAIVAGVTAEFGPEALKRIASNRVGVASRKRESWRLGLYLAASVVALATWWLTRDAASPFGHDWPRLTPMLVFAGVLMAFNLGRSVLEEHPALARLYLVAAPAGLVAAGFVAAWVTNREDWTHGAVGLAWVVLAVAWLARFEPTGWRWNGPGAVALLALSIIMGAFSGGAIRLADFLDRDGSVFRLRATAIYQWLALGFVAFVVVGFVATVFWYVYVRLEHAPRRRAAGLQVARFESIAEVARAVDVIATTMAMLMLTGGIGLMVHLQSTGRGLQEWVDVATPARWTGIVTVASWLTLTMVIAAYVSVRQGLRDNAFRSRFGILWDVTSFWPRTFHPFAPPAYASRAVPELLTRLTETARAAGDPDADPQQANGTAILSAHSQGTVISLAAVATMADDVRARVRVVTHGSPLRGLYQRYFPRYFPDTLFAECAGGLGPSPDLTDGGWMNFWRSTDPIGGPIFTGVEGPRGTLPPAGVRAALQSSLTGCDELPDVGLHDPVVEAHNPYRPLAPVRGHSSYMADAAMAVSISEMAAELSGEAPPPADPGPDVDAAPSG